MTTPRLNFPLLVSNQSQKEITHNEALNLIDLLTQPVVQSLDTTPPGSPAEGVAYIVTATATGAWVGKEDKVAYYQAGVWNFLDPFEGLTFWVVAEVKDYVYHASAWIIKP